MAKEEYRYIGKPTPRKDALDIVTGRTKFINDLSVPNMLHGKIPEVPTPMPSSRVSILRRRCGSPA